MDGVTIMAIFSALALGHTLYLAGFFWTSVHKSPSSFYLTLLLWALAIRILKSVLVILIPRSPDIIPAVGLIGLAAIGPSLFLYVSAFKNLAFKPGRRHLWHYLWALSLVVLIPIFNEQQMYIAYAISVAHLFVYLFLSGYVFGVKQEIFAKVERQWLRLLLLSLLCIGLTFFAQLLIETFMTYLMVTVVATVVIYGLSLWAGKKRKLFIEPRRGSNGMSDELLQIGKTIESLLTEKEMYIDSRLSIKVISEELQQPEYLVSQAVNAYFKKSFPEVLNEYRIAHATRLIDSKVYKDLSIEGIAYESGYNSISAFYRAFKHINGMTPAKFKDGGS